MTAGYLSTFTSGHERSEALLKLYSDCVCDCGLHQ